MIESERGCGYRKEGMYLIGTGMAVPCDRLPYKLEICPTCGAGIKFTRGYQIIDWLKFAGVHKTGVLKSGCKCKEWCPMCHPKEEQSTAIMWTGEKYYTMNSFIAEAMKMGVCKRIAGFPKEIKLGETWIFLAFKKAITVTPPTINDKGKVIKKGVYEAGIFYAFRPQRIEQIVSMTSAKKVKKMKKLQERGITVLVAVDVDEEGNVKETKPWEYWYQNYLEERRNARK